MEKAKATAVIPYRKTPSRNAGFEWVRRWYEHRVSEVIVADADTPLYSKAAAINAGVAKSSHAVLVIADADAVMCDWSLFQAIKIAGKQEAFVCATDCICYTTPGEAEALLRRDPSKPVSGKTYRRNRKFIKPYGGIWAIGKPLFLEVGGMDEAFIEWGWQDVAFHSSIVRAGKKRLRLSGPLFHLHHTPNSSHPLRKLNEQYFKRYYTHVKP